MWEIKIVFNDGLEVVTFALLYESVKDRIKAICEKYERSANDIFSVTVS